MSLQLIIGEAKEGGKRSKLSKAGGGDGVERLESGVASKPTSHGAAQRQVIQVIQVICNTEPAVPR